MNPIRFLIICPAAREFRVVAARQRPAWRMRIFRFSMLTPLAVAAAAPEYVQPRIVDENVEPVDLETDADIVGISCMTFNAPRAYELARQFRQRGKPVVLGGYHPTLLPQEAGEHADAVCVGEAEPNLPRLMEDFRRGRLQHLYAHQTDTFRPARSDPRLLRPRRYITSGVVQATRGCPNRCAFCSVTAFARHTFKKRPVADVVDEIRALPGRNFLFMDDNLAADPAYARDLLRELAPLNKRWAAQMGVAVAQDAGFLELLRAAGCRGAFVGLESLCQDSLDAVGKPFNRAAEYREAIRRLHAHGLAVYGALVLGFDHDAPPVFATTARFLEDAGLDALQLTILTPFPGTPLFEQLDRAGRIFDKNWEHYDMGHVVFRPKQMTPEELREGHRRLLARFYSWPAILRRLAGQTRYLSPRQMGFCLLVSLGYRFKLRRTGILRAPGRHAAATRTRAPAAGAGWLRPSSAPVAGD